MAQTVQDIKRYTEMIQTGSVEEKRDALFALRNFQTEMASRIAVPALRDASEIVRATAAKASAFLPSDEAVRVLVPLLNEKSPFIRREASLALGKIGNSAATESLVKLLLKDKDREVRAAAAIALGNIGDPAAILSLTDVLAKKRKKKEEFLRRSSARAIGNIARNLRGLKPVGVTPESFLPESFKSQSSRPDFILSENYLLFGKANAVLLQILKNEKEAPDVRRESAFALGEISDPASIPVLNSYRNSDDIYLREITMEALRHYPVN